MRSKFSRISRASEYLDRPWARSRCGTWISAIERAKVLARAGIKLEISEHLQICWTIAPAVGAQHAAVILELDAGAPGNDLVDDFGGQFPEKRILAVFAPAADHVIAGLDRMHEGRNRLGRVLQIGIQGHDDLPARLVKTGKNRGMLAEVAAEFDHDDVRVAGLKFPQDVQRLDRCCRRRYRSLRRACQDLSEQAKAPDAGSSDFPVH